MQARTSCASPVKPTISANGPTTLCAGGSVLLTASPGQSYKWSNGATTRAITVTQPGTYGVEVTDGNGCVGKAEDVVVSVAGKLKAPKIAYTEPLVVCQQGSLSMSVPEQEGAAYVWKKDGVPVYDDSHEYVAREAGVYTVELSNFCGAVRSTNKVEFKVLEPLPAFEVEAAGSLTFCKGGSVKLTVPEYKDVTYAWYRDGNPVDGTTHELVAKEAGSYTATLTNECGAYSSKNAQRVELLSLPEKPEVQDVTGCTKTALTLTATGASPGKYRWYTAATGGSALAGADGPSFTTPVLTASTTYYVAITNGQCESERVPVQANIKTKPTAPEIVVHGELTFCEGGAVELSTASYKGLQYVWLRNGEEVATGVSTIEASESGEYSLKVENECGTAYATSKVTVTVRPAPPAPEVQHGSTCGTGEVTLSATGGAAGDYRWYEGLTAAAMADVTGSSFTTPVLQNSRTYYVSLVKNGCESERVPVQASVLPVPQAVASVQDLEIESGGSTRLSGSGGVKYTWSPATGLDDPATASPVATPAQTTRYTLTVTNDAGCEDTTSVVVAVRQLLVIPNAFSPNGDGVNDTWEVKNLEYFPEAKVEVYNRWGNLIFERSNYRGDWDGTYRGAALPVSTYFYVISIPNKKKFTGYVNIVN
ncbi:gliding motility-associated C-terminal domain-containing protein [Pontibacter actiniarum]|uniref:gliding motility-associated C-terminal domain-containing protein n=1 Tax=Pontibacter actiniarum TaxID=323450 RepID=UPI0004058F14|nr:T9SS C-terminal target domain-containing protein [Pontibacter actiniarum]